MTTKQNVLSLFDGKSSGYTAMELAGIPVGNYYSAEIDKYAIKVSDAIHPNQTRLGSVTEWRDWNIDWASIDIILGGFPCQSWSMAGKQMGDKDERGMLFWVMLDIMKHVRHTNPKAHFLIENVKMKKEFEEYVTYHMENSVGEVHKTLINSALVSAQNRNRYYWTSFPVSQPEDRGIVLSDVIESRCLSYLVPRGNNSGGFRAKNGKVGAISSSSWEHNNFLVFRKDRPDKCRPSSVKSTALTGGANSGGNHSQMDVLVFNNFEIPLTGTGRIDIRKSDKVRRYTVRECFRLQTVPEHYIDKILGCGVSNSQLYKIAGNGWTDEVIAHILRERGK